MKNLLWLLLIFLSPLCVKGYEFSSSDNSVENVVKGAVSPYSLYSSSYDNKESSGDSYINILSTNIGLVKRDMDPNLEEMIAVDRARTEQTYLGQFNIINQTMSFCGLNGIIWGYHIAKIEDVVKIEAYNKLSDEDKIKREKELKVNPILYVSRKDNIEIPVYRGDALLDAGRKLMGIKENKRFPIYPGSEVKCATKKYLSPGPKYIWSSIAVCISEDRESNANLFITNAGEFNAKDKEHIKEFEKKLIKDISHAALRFGSDNNILFKEIWVTTRLRWISKDQIGCALTLIPYISIAKNAIPDNDTNSLAEISLNDWEKKLELQPLPPFNSEKDGFITEYVNFKSREYSSDKVPSQYDSESKISKDESSWTPMQIGFFKDHYPPADQYANVYGLRLGLPITYDDGSNLYGLDLSAFFSATSSVKGLQISMVGTQTKNLDGVQISVANFIKNNINGLQLGGVNCSNDNQGLQIGLVNYTDNMQGFQIGLVNIIKNGWLPFFPIINLNF